VKYDNIATDCTDLRYKTNANLYDLEYFQLCREAITDDGLVVVWMPLGGLSTRGFRSALRTFQEVFPEMSVWYFTNQPTHYCLLIATKGPLKIDWDKVSTATAMPEIETDLKEIDLRDPAKLVSSFVADERTLEEHLKGFPLNTEDFPIIEFESPRFGYDSRPLRDNQMDLYNVQVPVSDLVTGEPDDVAERLWRLQQANFVVFKGHSAYRLYDYKEAALRYMEALKIAPDDESIKDLLDFPELVNHYENTKRFPTMNTLVTGLGLAEVFFVQGRYPLAVTYANETAKMLPREVAGEPLPDDVRAVAFGLYTVLARSYANTGVREKAEEFVAAAEKYAANDEQMTLLREHVSADLERPAS
jgi:tetratricopeptide (TPR) repeat protein